MPASGTVAPGHFRARLANLVLFFAVPIWAMGIALQHGAGTAGAPMIAVFPLWYSTADMFGVVTDADLAPLDLGPVSGTVIVVPDADAQLASLRDGGAWLFLNAVAVALCGGPRPT